MTPEVTRAQHTKPLRWHLRPKYLRLTQARVTIILEWNGPSVLTRFSRIRRTNAPKVEDPNNRLKSSEIS